MNTEEFEGHLMAALHGPNRGAIVGRIVDVVTEQLKALSDEDRARLANEFFQGLATYDERLWVLEMMAHVRTAKDKSFRDEGFRIRAMRAEFALWDMLKESIRQRVPEEMRQMAKDLGVFDD